MWSFFYSKFHFSKILAFFVVTLLGIVACNTQVGGTPNSNQPSSSTSQTQMSQLFKKHLSANIQPMDIDWRFDGLMTPASLPSQMHDGAWHILTATVTSIGSSVPPTAVDGLIYEVDPPTGYGEDLEIKDINCKTAIFGKVGDSCGVYLSRA